MDCVIQSSRAADERFLANDNAFALQEGDVIELCQVSDIRAGGLPKDMKLQTQLAIKHGENLEEKSLTICSGTDYINVNYQHIVCPDAATAKVSDSITINYIGCVGTEYVCTCKVNGGGRESFGNRHHRATRRKSGVGEGVGWFIDGSVWTSIKCDNARDGDNVTSVCVYSSGRLLLVPPLV